MAPSKSIEDAYIIPLPSLSEAEREEINQMIQRRQPPILASKSDNLSFVWFLTTVSYTLVFTWIARWQKLIGLEITA